MAITQEHFEEVREHLRKLGAREIDPEKPTEGLCFELDEKFGVDIKNNAVARYLGFKDYQDYCDKDGLGGNRRPEGVRASVVCPVYCDAGVSDFITPEERWHVGNYAQSRRDYCTWLAENTTPDDYTGYNDDEEQEDYSEGGPYDDAL